MKPNLFLFLTICALASSAAYSFRAAEPIESKKSCSKCYCSDKCGPRDRTANDSPFCDKETGQCFCKQRDYDNYLPHGCHRQPKPAEGEIDCCNDCHKEEIEQIEEFEIFD